MVVETRRRIRSHRRVVGGITGEPKPVLPLTDHDRQLIQEFCEQQSIEDPCLIEGFSNAYQEAKTFSGNPDSFKYLTPMSAKSLILGLGKTVSERNSEGFIKEQKRRSLFTPAELMNNFCRYYSRSDMAPLNAYRMFLEISPINEGNEILGYLLWAIGVTQKTGEWPQRLPDAVAAFDF